MATSSDERAKRAGIIIPPVPDGENAANHAKRRLVTGAEHQFVLGQVKKFAREFKKVWDKLCSLEERIEKLEEKDGGGSDGGEESVEVDRGAAAGS